MKGNYQRVTRKKISYIDAVKSSSYKSHPRVKLMIDADSADGRDGKDGDSEYICSVSACATASASASSSSVAISMPASSSPATPTPTPTSTPIPTPTYCNNCGEAGHLFKYCTKPIISCGLIVYRTDPDGQRSYLMIQRKDSFGFIDFIRGRYTLTNKNQIIGLIDEMTNKEKQMILHEDFKKLWTYMWGTAHFTYGSEEYHAEEKILELRRGVKTETEIYTLLDLVIQSKTAWSVPEWGFPKGRRNLHEKNIQTALREFSEETGYPSSAVNIINNLAPFEELFMGSNFKAYRHLYYVAQMNSADFYDPTKFQKSEVRSIGWKHIEECMALIRPYSVEKIHLIDRIDRVLTSNTIIS